MTKVNRKYHFLNISSATFISSYLYLNVCRNLFICLQSNTKPGLPFLLYATVSGLTTLRIRVTCETTPFLIKLSTSSCTKDIFSLLILYFFKIILVGIALRGNLYPSFTTFNIKKSSVISFHLSRAFP